MRIHYLSASRVISDRANAVHVVRMSAALSSLGHDVTLHAYQGGGTDREVFDYFGVSSTFELRRYARSKRPDAFIMHRLHKLGMPTRSLMRYLQGRQLVRPKTHMDRDGIFFARNAEWLLACLDRGSRFIFESHKPARDVQSRWIHGRLFGHPGFLGLVVITQPLRDLYREMFPAIPPDRIVVKADGADEVDSSLLTATANARFQVGYVGHLYEGRGGELIVALARTLPEADFHLVGGRSEDLARLSSLRPPENLFLHGHKPPAILSSLYPKFDVLLAPYQRRVSVGGSAQETSAYMSPLKVFEYMSWAKPIVASDLPVLREVLVQGCNALLVDPEDVRRWETALRRLMANRKLRDGLARTAGQLFRERYTWKARARDVLSQLVH